VKKLKLDYRSFYKAHESMMTRIAPLHPWFNKPEYDTVEGVVTEFREIQEELVKVLSKRPTGPIWNLPGGFM